MSHAGGEERAPGATYAGPVRRPAELPTLDELRALAAEHGIEHVGVAPATVMERARAELHRRRDAGLAAGMGFTYHDPDRATDPARAVPGARSVIVGARSYLADDDPPRPPGPQARVARYAWVDHYAPLRDGLRAMARRIRAADHRAVALRRRQRRSSTARSPTGPGWAGSARTPTSCCRAPGAGSCSAASSPPPPTNRRRRRSPTAAGPATAASTPARPVPSWPPGVVDANRCLAWVLQQPGSDRPGTSGSRSATASTAATTARRPARRRCASGAATGARCRPAPWPGSTPSTSWPPTTRPCSTATAAGTSPGATRGGCAATPSSCSATSPIRPTLAVVAVLARYRHDDDPILAEHARWASDRLSLGDRRGRSEPDGPRA